MPETPTPVPPIRQPHLPLPRLPAGAILAPSGPNAQAILGAFTADLSSRGFRVVGLTQKTARDAEGRKTGMHLHSVDGSATISVAQDLGRGSSSCVIDESGVAEAAALLRQGIEEHCDLLAVNKFAHLEHEGRGFHAELLLALSRHVPVLVTLPPEMLDPWLDFTGGATTLLPACPDSLWRWWGPHRLYPDLVNSVPVDSAGEVRRVVVGLNWCLVEGEHGCGLAHTPPRGTTGCHPVDASRWVGQPLAALAAALTSLNPFEAALGLAAINAHHNRPTLDLPVKNGLDMLGPTPGHVVIAGGFPGASERFPHLSVLEQTPGPGQFPPAATAGLLSEADAALLTASSLVNHSLPDLLSPLMRVPAVPAVLTGPGTPLCSRLLHYGLTGLAGFVIDDSDGCARAVAAGAGARALKPFGRTVVLSA